MRGMVCVAAASAAAASTMRESFSPVGEIANDSADWADLVRDWARAWTASWRPGRAAPPGNVKGNHNE